MKKYIYTKHNNVYDLDVLRNDKDTRDEIFAMIKQIENENSKGYDTISLNHARIVRLVASLRKTAAERKFDLGEIIINYKDTLRGYSIDIYLKKYQIGIDVDGPVGHPKKDDIEKMKYYAKLGIRLLRIRSSKCEIIEDDDVILMSDNLTIRTAKKLIAKLAAIIGFDIYSYNDIKKMIDAYDEADFIIQFYFENNKSVFQNVMDRWDNKLIIAQTAKIHC